MNKSKGEGFADNRSAINDDKSANGAETTYVGKGQQSSKQTDDKYSDLGGLSSLDIDQNTGLTKKSPLKNIAFCRGNSSINTVALDGSSLTIQITIDVSNLKLFALLMCKGKLREKARILFDIVMGPTKLLQGETLVSWKSGRIIKVFKQLIYFSEIFPKKYQGEFVHELARNAVNKTIASPKDGAG